MSSRLLLVFFLFLAVDAVLPPRFQPTAWTLRGAIRLYQLSLSPILGATKLASCRFDPTCSSYGLGAITKYGTWHGGAKTIWRVLRCNPFGGSGFDPP